MNPRRLVTTVLPPALFAAAVVLLWHVTSYRLFPDARQRGITQPAPMEVVRVGFLKWRNLSELLDGLTVTTRITLLGLAASVAVGVVLAVLMSQSRLVERSVFPYAVVLQTVPIIALTPVIRLVLGSGLLPRVLICVLIAVFPIITNTLFGLKSVERGQHDLFTLHRANRWTRLWKLHLPAALPAMFTGFRISAGLSVIGAIVAEFFFGTGPKGLGRLIIDYTQQNATAKVVAAITLTAVLGIVLFLLFGWLSSRLTRHWRSADPLAR